jgi:L-amino acid N-acyltransferase YncA
VRAIAVVHIESWTSSYRGMLPDEFLAGISLERRMEGWTRTLAEPRRATWVGTTAEGKVVGFCEAGPNREEPKAYQGEVYAIYLLDEVKRNGLGRALFRESAAWLKQQDLRSMVVWALRCNWGARKFYEALGGEQVCEKPITIAGVGYIEVAYGWKDFSVASERAG